MKRRDACLLVALGVTLALLLGQSVGRHRQRTADAHGLFGGALWRCAIEQHRMVTVDEAYLACFPPFGVAYHVDGDSFRLDTASATPGWRARDQQWRARIRQMKADSEGRP